MRFPRVELSGDLIGTATLEVERRYLRLEKKTGLPNWIVFVGVFVAVVCIVIVLIHFQNMLIWQIVMVPILWVVVGHLLPSVFARRRFTLLIAPDSEDMKYRVSLDDGFIRIHRGGARAKTESAEGKINDIWVSFGEPEDHLRCYEAFTGDTGAPELGMN
jgi:hypothetical protein